MEFFLYVTPIVPALVGLVAVVSLVNKIKSRNNNVLSPLGIAWRTFALLGLSVLIQIAGFVVCLIFFGWWIDLQEDKSGAGAAPLYLFLFGIPLSLASLIASPFYIIFKLRAIGRG